MIARESDIKVKRKKSLIFTSKGKELIEKICSSVYEDIQEFSEVEESLDKKYEYLIENNLHHLFIKIKEE